MELYSHNQKVYNEAISMLNKTHRCAIVQAPGSGKSYVLMALLDSIFKGMKVMWVVPKASIARSILLYPEWHYNVAFCTYDKLDKISREYSVVIFDELHRAGAPTYEPKVRAMMDKAIYVVGVDGTPNRYLDRNRNMAVELFGDNIVYGLSREQAIKNGVLPEFDYVAILSDVGEIFEGVDIDELDFFTKKRIKNLRLNEYQLSERMRKHVVGHKKCVIFYPNSLALESGDDDIRIWFGEDVSIFQVYSKQTEKVNNSQIEAFNNSTNVSVIKSVDMLNEGVHLNDVTLCIFARKTVSGNVFEQQLGRAASASNKTIRPKYIDLVQNYQNVKFQLWYVNSKQREGRQKVNKKCLLNCAEILISYDEVLLEVCDIMQHINKVWSDREDFIIKSFYPIEGTECYVRLDGRTKSQVSRRAKMLGVTKNMAWTDEEDNIIREYYRVEKDAIWERLPGRSQYAIRTRAKKLGLIHVWTDLEDLFILQNIDKAGVDGIVNYFSDCEETEVMAHLKKMGLL